MPVVFVLASTDSKHRFVIPNQGRFILGRDPSCDFPLSDPTVSRNHTEFQLCNDGKNVEFRDLNSRNGTWLNGRRTESGNAVSGDVLQFGSVRLRLSQETEATAVNRQPAPNEAGLTIIREREVPTTDKILSELALSDHPKLQATRRLAQLVGIAQRLSSFLRLDELLEAIASDLFSSFDADRVAILLIGADGSLETRVSRDRLGAIPRPVSRVISEGVASRQIALLTNDASHDVLTTGDSVVQQAVKSAIAAPLLSSDRATLGVLYVDHLRASAAFSDDDLAFLVAIAGIAAAAVEREITTERMHIAERAKENLGRYFTPQLAERIASGSFPAALGGARQPVVVLFSDIRSFTAIAESLAPTAMAAQLNEYFEAMVAIVFKHDGALDKFIGDALMAYWGAPESSESDATRAVTAAVEMQRVMVELNSRWQLEGRPQLRAGIGVHAGDAFVGNVGSPRRMEFTLIGDTVNVANRLCSLAQSGEILVSELVANSTQGHFSCTLRSGIFVPRHTGPDSPVWEVIPPNSDDVIRLSGSKGD